MSRSQPSRLQTLVAKVTGSGAVSQTGLVTAAFGLSQVLRLISNVILAHLLAPAIFGAMTLINTLRTGVDLLTDIGVRQNIIVSPDGDKPPFFNTAWTLQLIRGAGLMVFGMATAWPVAQLYGKPELFLMLLASSSIFLIGSMSSPGRYLLLRHRKVGKIALFDLGTQVCGMAISILFALLMPTVWGTLWALIASTALVTVISYSLIDRRQLKFMVSDDYARAILHFGKWIFVSSLIFFVATNFDRLYLPTVIPLALFGVYGIARVVGDAGTVLVQKIGEAVILPAVARLGEDVHGRLPRIARIRRLGLLAIGAGIGCGIAIGDLFVDLVYDERYHGAQVLLPLLLMGTWFSVQSALAEATLLGLSRPQHTAAGNLAKLVWSLILIPIAMSQWGLLAGIAVIAFADAPRYLALLVSQVRAGLNFVLDDLASLLTVAAVALLVRLGLIQLGLIDGLVTAAQWREMAPFL